MTAARTIELGVNTSDAVRELRALQSEVERLTALLGDVRLPATSRSPRVRILHEPLTYEARLVRDPSAPRSFRAVQMRENRSYVQDFTLAQTKGDQSAQERLDRHAREMKVLAETRDDLFHPDVEVEFEARAVNWTNGTGGYFAPPLWIIEQFAYQPTPERALSRLAPQFELPVGAQSVNIPAWTQGADVGNAQVSSTAVSQDVLDQAVGSAVATIAGNFDVPMQMLEQSPQGAHLDWVAFTTMEARYGYKLEQQLIIGQGASTPQGSGNDQLMGIYNHPLIPTANQISYTGAAEGSATAATSMFSSLGLAIAKIGQNRFAPPEAWLMTTSRMAWLGSSEDTQSRPLMIADKDGTGKFDLIAIEVQLDDAIPRTSGSGGNEERIIACRPSDWLILESERRTQVMTEVLSGTLQARLQMRRYVAAILRRPESVAYLLGSGMATGGGF